MRYFCSTGISSQPKRALKLEAGAERSAPAVWLSGNGDELVVLEAHEPQIA